MKEDNYLQSSNGNVYKVMDKYLLQLSPWKYGDDRRVYTYNSDDMTIITYQNACMIVNKQYNEIDEEWEHNGKKYGYIYICSSRNDSWIFNRINSLWIDYW